MDLLLLQEEVTVLLAKYCHHRARADISSNGKIGPLDFRAVNGHFDSSSWIGEEYLTTIRIWRPNPDRIFPSGDVPYEMKAGSSIENIHRLSRGRIHHWMSLGPIFLYFRSTIGPVIQRPQKTSYRQSPSSHSFDFPLRLLPKRPNGSKSCPRLVRIVKRMPF